MIFVFGSNRAGYHGAGAAAYAHQKLNAEWGVGEGLTGDCYALPTKDEKIQDISLNEIRQHVSNFIAFAAAHPELEFKVTCVGTGLAVWEHKDIAPLFHGAPSNCYFDTLWQQYLGEDAKFWGTF